MVDKVRPLKLEDPTTGTQLDMAPTEANPSEDYLSAKGLALEGSDTILVGSSGTEVQFMDGVSGTKVVSDLLDADQENFDNTGTDLTSTESGPAIRELANRNGPKDFDYIERTSSLSTSGGSFTVYSTLNFNVSDNSGTNTYRLNADFLWGHDSASNDIRVRVALDGSPVKEVRIEPKDRGGDQRFQNNILIYATNLSNGSHTLELEFRPANASRASTLYESIIECWRVE